MKLCLCGCGLPVKSGRSFVTGSHASRAVWAAVKAKHGSAAGLLKALRRSRRKVPA